MIATLPMYDRPETAAANDTLWSHIARHLPGAPAKLDRTASPDAAWTDPALVLSQTCGLPFSTWVRDHATYVASPDFRLPDTPAGHYHSVIITRAGDDRPIAELLNARPIANDAQSQSGYAALWRFALSQNAQLAPLVLSGAHAHSARAVAEDHADIAAIDANSWRFISRWDSWASRLTVVARTSATPAMPYICGPAQDPEQLRNVLQKAIAALSDTEKDTLGLYGITMLSPDAYLSVPPPPSARKRITT